MGVELHIEVTSPLSADEEDLLSGITVMLLVIANRNLAQEAFPEVFRPNREEHAGVVTDAIDPQPCGLVAIDGTVCVSRVGHRGPHRFRKLTVGTGTAAFAARGGSTSSKNGTGSPDAPGKARTDSRHVR